MGLSLSYELRLPATLSSDDVNNRLMALRARAVRGHFRHVSPVIEAPFNDWDEGLGWERYLHVWADVIARPTKGEKPRRRGDVTTARAFVVHPGPGCEAAAFGFLRRAARDGTAPEWYWCCACKTQYASAISEEHFVACHTTLTGLLDHAVDVGIDVTVFDEGNYWDTRDTKQLLAEVRYMNRLIARFAGKVSDSLPGDDSVRASIFEHPEFERLEMEPLRRPSDFRNR